jgi:hypothetical protein
MYTCTEREREIRRASHTYLHTLSVFCEVEIGKNYLMESSKTFGMEFKLSKYQFYKIISHFNFKC